MLLVVVVGEAVLVPVTDQTFRVVGILVHFLVTIDCKKIFIKQKQTIYKFKSNWVLW